MVTTGRLLRAQVSRPQVSIYIDAQIKPTGT